MLFKVMIPTDSYHLCSGKKSSDEKKHQMDKKKPPPSDKITPLSTNASPEPTEMSMSELLRQFRAINDRISSFETTMNDIKFRPVLE